MNKSSKLIGMTGTISISESASSVNPHMIDKLEITDKLTNRKYMHEVYDYVGTDGAGNHVFSVKMQNGFYSPFIISPDFKSVVAHGSSNMKSQDQSLKAAALAVSSNANRYWDDPNPLKSYYNHHASHESLRVILGDF